MFEMETRTETVTIKEMDRNTTLDKRETTKEDVHNITVTLCVLKVGKESIDELMVKYTACIVKGIRIDNTYIVAKYISSIKYDESINCLTIIGCNNQLYTTHDEFIIYYLGQQVGEHHEQH